MSRGSRCDDTLLLARINTSLRYFTLKPHIVSEFEWKNFVPPTCFYPFVNKISNIVAIYGSWFINAWLKNTGERYTDRIVEEISKQKYDNFSCLMLWKLSNLSEIQLRLDKTKQSRYDEIIKWINNLNRINSQRVKNHKLSDPSNKNSPWFKHILNEHHHNLGVLKIISQSCERNAFLYQTSQDCRQRNHRRIYRKMSFRHEDPVCTKRLFTDAY